MDSKELQEQNYMIIKKVHIWLVVLAMVIGAIAQVSLSYRMVQDHEARIEKLEKENSSKHDLLNEIRYNLKNFMEANGQKYIELK